MKSNSTNRYIAIAFIALLFAVFSCSHIKREDVTLNLKLIDGSWKQVTYTLPCDCNFYVGNHRGSYYLIFYDNGKNGFCPGAKCRGQLHSAVIDFEIISRKNCR